MGGGGLSPLKSDEELLNEYAHHFPMAPGTLGVDMSPSYYGVGLQGGIIPARFERLKQLLPHIRVLVCSSVVLVASSVDPHLSDCHR